MSVIMDLTRDFICWRLGACSRSAIIEMVDKEILASSDPFNALIDLSLSADVSDYVFADRMAPFIDESRISKDSILPLLIEAVRKTTPETAETLCHGLSQLIFPYWKKNTDHPVDHLIYPLDHWLHESFPQDWDRLAEITRLFREWLALYDKAQGGPL